MIVFPFLFQMSLNKPTTIDDIKSSPVPNSPQRCSKKLTCAVLNKSPLRPTKNGSMFSLDLCDNQPSSTIRAVCFNKDMFPNFETNVTWSWIIQAQESIWQFKLPGTTTWPRHQSFHCNITTNSSRPYFQHLPDPKKWNWEHPIYQPESKSNKYWGSNLGRHIPRQQDKENHLSGRQYRAHWTCFVERTSRKHRIW